MFLVLIHQVLITVESIVVLKRSIGNFWRLRRWSEESSTKSQSNDLKMSWRL